MDFSSLFEDISATLNYIVLFIGDFVSKITGYQLVIFALIMVIAIPAFGYLLDFIRDVNADSGEVLNNGIKFHEHIVKTKAKKAELLEKENFKKIKMQKSINAQIRAKALADEFFKNNPNKMSISIMGFKFFQKDFEKKTWNNGGRRRSHSSYSGPKPEPKPPVDIDIKVDDE